jgi:hypothetical protein
MRVWYCTAAKDYDDNLTECLNAVDGAGLEIVSQSQLCLRFKDYILRGRLENPDVTIVLDIDCASATNKIIQVWRHEVFLYWFVLIIQLTPSLSYLLATSDH